MKSVTTSIAVLLTFLFGLLLGGCSDSSNNSATNTNSASALRIISGSENKDDAANGSSLKAVFIEAAKEANVEIAQTSFEGSIDIANEIKKGKDSDYDVVMPASTAWISYGDSKHTVSDVKSIYRTPIVLGVKPNVAKRLGWETNSITAKELFAAVDAGQLNLSMTSASQSNSGFGAYIGFLNSTLGKDSAIVAADLENPILQTTLRSFYRKLDHTSGSSGFLKDKFVESYDFCGGMINYECSIIETNLTLVAKGKDPLKVIYLKDATSIADAPMGFIDHGNAEKKAAYLRFQEILLSEKYQKKFLEIGRRTGRVGLSVSGADKNVFNSNWGIDVQRTLSPIPTPATSDIQKALSLYQTSLRKPSRTLYLLDVSASMLEEAQGLGLTRIDALKRAMRRVLLPDLASEFLIQPSHDDITMVYSFSDDVEFIGEVKGDDPKALADLNRMVSSLSPTNGTRLYSAAAVAVKRLLKMGESGYFDSIILLTDGEPDDDIDTFKEALSEVKSHRTIPVFPILFGEANKNVLEGLSKATEGKLFNGQKDLEKAMRTARGFN